MGKYTHMHAVEAQHAKRWHDEEGVSVEQIGKLLKRCSKTVKKHIFAKPAAARMRRPGRPAMSDQDYAMCDKALAFLQRRANAKREVTAAMVKERAGVSHCERTIRNAFKAHGKPFRKLREKPLLTPGDVVARLSFAEKHGARPRSAWLMRPRPV